MKKHRLPVMTTVAGMYRAAQAAATATAVTVWGQTGTRPTGTTNALYTRN